MTKKKQNNFPASLLFVDKEAGPTSHDVVARTRREFQLRRVGHAGTLDPAATGLLILGLGKATRLLQYVSGSSKCYQATIRLGQTTTSDDADGEVVTQADPKRLAELTEPQIGATLTGFTGNIQQRPPNVSAIKVDGVRSHAMVRRGQTPDLVARSVEISELQLTGLIRSPESIEVTVTCEVSSGTYIRSLARDVGAELGVGGHISQLRRTSIGPFSLADVAAAPVPALAVAEKLWPTIDIDSEEVDYVRQGKPLSELHPLLAVSAPNVALQHTDQLIAVVRQEAGDWVYGLVM